MMNMFKIKYNCFLLVTTIASIGVVFVSCEHCHRTLSRIVRHEIKTKFMPHFHEMKIAVPDSCLFNPNRDIYLVQEEKVIEESVSKYKCNFCGKAFLSRHYIDLHLDNRHADYVRQDKDVVCFADLCDIVRCDIIAGWRQADFWEMSLCLEDDMKELTEKCQKTMKNCIPAGLTTKEDKELNHRLGGMCRFLTCKLYWEGQPKQESDGVVMYSVVTVFLGIFLIIYYCIAYHYYYTDTFSDSDDYTSIKHPFPGIQSKPKRSRPIRQRYYQGQLYDEEDEVDTNYDDDDIDDDDR